MTEKANLYRIFLRFPALNFTKGEIILRADEPPRGFYYIESGFVKVYSIEEDGSENLHIIYKKDEIFPVIWLFKEETVGVYYEALSDAVLRRAKRNEVLALVGDKPELLTEIIQKIIDVLTVHVDRLDNLQLSHAYPRVIARILSLVKRFGEKKRGGIVISAPIGHKDIANSISLTRETASREIEKLEVKGLIKYKGREIMIPNIAKLKKELSLHYVRKPL